MKAIFRQDTTALILWSTAFKILAFCTAHSSANLVRSSQTLDLHSVVTITPFNWKSKARSTHTGTVGGHEQVWAVALATVKW